MCTCMSARNFLAMDDVDRIERYRAHAAELKIQHQRAAAHAESVCAELLAGDLLKSHGSQAYRNAFVDERDALEAYQKAVLNLADQLKLRGERTG